MEFNPIIFTSRTNAKSTENKMILGVCGILSSKPPTDMLPSSRNTWMSFEVK